jgi:hypothetical protein
MTQGAFPVTLNPGQSATIILQYDPTVLGVETGQLTVSSNSSTNPTATIPHLDLEWASSRRRLEDSHIEQ